MKFFRSDNSLSHYVELANGDIHVLQIKTENLNLQFQIPLESSVID